MPSKSSKPKSETKQDSKKKQQIKRVHVDKFDISKFSVDPIPADVPNKGAKEGNQYNAYVRYDFGPNKNAKETDKPEPTTNRCVIVTDEIEIKKGGIPKVDAEAQRPTDNECMYFWLNTNEDENGRKLRDKVFKPIDQLAMKKINDEKNKNFIKKVGEKSVPVPLDSLNYVEICRESVQSTKPNASGVIPDVYERVKVKIGTEYDAKADKNDEKKLKVTVYGPDSDEQIEINTLDDLRREFPWGCKASFILEVNKFWAARAIMKKQRDCGFGIKVIAINVTSKPKINAAAAIDKSIFAAGDNSDSDSESEKGDKSGSESESESESESDNDSESGSESESDDEKPDPKKGKGAKKVEETKETKETKKTGKGAKAEKSEESEEDGSDDESPAPAKKTKATEVKKSVQKKTK